MRKLKFSAVIIAILIAFDITLAAIIAAKASVYVPTMHLDGAFQTFSGLLRLLQGEVPGKDFFPYLGTGPLFLLFPMFYLLGGTVTSSVFSAYFVTLICLEAIFTLIFYLIVKPRSVTAIFAISSIPLVFIMLFDHGPGSVSQLELASILELGNPGNSMRPLRSFAPYLLAFAAVLSVHPKFSPKLKPFFLGFITGLLASIWSNDYGLVSAGLFSLGVFVWKVFQGKKGFIYLGWFALSTLVGVAVTGTIVTAGNFWKLVEYNLVDVRGDQFWYFGDWGSGAHIYSLHDFGNVLLISGAWYPLSLSILLALSAFTYRNSFLAITGFIGLALVAGGAVATIGGHISGYFWPAVLWGLFVSLFLLIRLILAALNLVPIKLILRSKITSVLSVGFLTLALLVDATFSIQGIREYRGTRNFAASPQSGHIFVPELGGFLNQAFLPLIESAKTKQGQFAEEYFGLSSAITGPNRNLSVDAVIHALGKERDAFESYMSTLPETVITTVPSMTFWVAWNMSANWWFYRQLFANYSPRQSSPTTLEWTRISSVNNWPELPCTVSQDGQRVEVWVDKPGLIELSLEYESSGKFSRSFSMMRNNINFAADAGGYVALDPGATTQSLPASADSSGINTFDLRHVSGDPKSATTTIKSCSAKKIIFAAPDEVTKLFALWLGGPFTPFDLNDEHWRRGVSLNSASILLSSAPRNVFAMQSAKSITFSDGQVRRIESISVVPPYIEVKLTGEILNPEVDGHPSPFILGQ